MKKILYKFLQVGNDAEGWMIFIWFNNKVALGNKLQRGFLAWWISKRNQKKEYREEVEEFKMHSAKKLKKEYSEGDIGRQQTQGASFSWLGPQKEPKENSKYKRYERKLDEWRWTIGRNFQASD